MYGSPDRRVWPTWAAAYLPAEQLLLLRKAWTVGAAAHVGQTRRSGEPYITHPVAVATGLSLIHI